VVLHFLLLEQGILNYGKSALFQLRRLVVDEGAEFRSELLLGVGVSGCIGFMRASQSLLGKMDCSSFR
jgi:hypothetical protein